MSKSKRRKKKEKWNKLHNSNRLELIADRLNNFKQKKGEEMFNRYGKKPIGDINNTTLSLSKVIKDEGMKTCSICLAINTSANKGLKFHLWHKKWFGNINNRDKHICENCLEDLKEVRKMCHKQIDNVDAKLLQNFRPGLVKKVSWNIKYPVKI